MVDITAQEVAAGTDDTVESHGSTDWLPTHTSVPLSHHTTASSRRSGAVRWTLDIPQGATIDSCTIDVVSNGGSNAMEFDMKAQLVENSITPAQSFWDTGTIAQTIASVAWQPGVSLGVTETSPDLKTILQEIVNQAGWASGNGVTFLFMSRNQAGASYDFASLEHATRNAPRITVSYTAAAGGGGGGGGMHLNLPGASLGSMNLGNGDLEL